MQHALLLISWGLAGVAIGGLLAYLQFTKRDKEAKWLFIAILAICVLLLFFHP